jgi:hypothetical protein
MRAARASRRAGGEAVDEKHEARQEQIAEPAADAREHQPAPASRGDTEHAAARRPVEETDHDEPGDDGRAGACRGRNQLGFRPSDGGRELREKGSDDRAAECERRQRPDGDGQRNGPGHAR